MRTNENLPDPWHFARPDLAKAYLQAFDLKLSAARGLFARRRMGKTEFLRRDLMPEAVTKGYLTAYTNLWDNRTSPETALVTALTETLEPKGAAALLSKLRTPVKKVKASAKLAGAVEGSLEAELGKPGVDRTVALHEVLKRIDRAKKPLLLVIDEAQVLAGADHSDFAHALRAALDIRKDRVKVIFAGSSETTLRAMFARASEPFYNWAPLEPFPLLGDEFVAFTVELLNSMARQKLTLEQGRHAFDELHRTPEFFKRFIERYMLYQPQGEAAALAYTKSSVFSDEHSLTQWREMKPADRAILYLLARGESDLHSSATLEKLGIMLGKPATRNTTGHALRRLLAATVITRLAMGDYRIEDEAFADWIRKRPEPTSDA
ncbi:ATP-binding protein [Cupriavidus sp. AcVe19-6a]|uniref:ATP-binding protein n=1 Tax=Cupriavidus sp. AcVe19-6a TaxID=2821358 RepID=UPI001AE352AC|nr:ATP-binding protein [Cupriavidus sp. AcVe19-6a]MBP0640204.1 ATP-binding protein [Cupriavidus sp. AcVe19-6a]